MLYVMVYSGSSESRCLCSSALKKFKLGKNLMAEGIELQKIAPCSWKEKDPQSFIAGRDNSLVRELPLALSLGTYLIKSLVKYSGWFKRKIL